MKTLPLLLYSINDKTWKDYLSEDYVDFLTSYSLTNGSDGIREELVLNSIGAKSIAGKHGWDGILGSSFIEVKCETIGKSTEKLNKVQGKGVFNNLTWRSFEKYRKNANNSFYINAGFDLDGKILYIIGFKIKEIIHHLENKLIKALPQGDVKNRNISIPITSSSLPEKFEVIYLPEILDMTKYTDPFLLKLMRNKLEKTRVHNKKVLNKIKKLKDEFEKDSSTIS